jgi:hypothetical protein
MIHVFVFVPMGSHGQYWKTVREHKTETSSQTMVVIGPVVELSAWQIALTLGMATIGLLLLVIPAPRKPSA